MSDQVSETDGPLNHLPDNATPLEGMEIVCQDCKKVRTVEPNYSPIQPIMGKPIGWYTGKDGEFCPDCITRLMSMGQPQFAHQYHAWKEGDPR